MISTSEDLSQQNGKKNVFGTRQNGPKEMTTDSFLRGSGEGVLVLPLVL